MKIKKISVDNFTVFKKLEMEYCKGINVIIGENGTGKTHLLKLLYSISQIASSDSIISFKNYFSNDLRQLMPMKTVLTVEGVENKSDKVYLMGKLELNINGMVSEIGQDEECSYEISYPNETLDVIFIPAKEMLSMSNITRIDDKYSKELSLDKTLLDIIKKAQNIKPNIIPELAKKIVSKIEKVIDGKVFMKDDNSFWVRKDDETEIPFTMEAEGFRKFGLLWQLLMNESIVKGTILLWDEPEANINPKLIPVLVEVLLELEKSGVQIFISTHDYFLAKYFEVKMKEENKVLFHALYKTELGDGVSCETQEKFSFLENNNIIDESIRLYKEEVKKVME